MPTHISFPSINQFHNVRKAVQQKAQFKGLDETGEPILDRAAVSPTIKYEGTIKLHGCCNSICFGDEIHYQSREQIITPEKDNYGFARWASELTSDDIAIIKSNFLGRNVICHGEWVGKGVQKSVGISEIAEKSWFVFAAQDIETEEWLDIREWTFPYRVYNIYNYPTFEIDIDFESSGEMINKINEWVLEVEKECPVAKHFGISGVGEGIVWRPLDSKYSDPRFIFKTKGSEHANSHVKKLATVDVERVASIQEFCNKVLDNERLEQGFRYLLESGKDQNLTSLGDFIRWIVGDILKEESESMSASNITEKELGKVVQLQARRWFFERLKTV